MQQFWENPKIAHLIFVLEMRAHLIFVLKNIQFSFSRTFNFPFNFHRGRSFRRCAPGRQQRPLAELEHGSHLPVTARLALQPADFGLAKKKKLLVSKVGPFPSDPISGKGRQNLAAPE